MTERLSALAAPALRLPHKPLHYRLVESLEPTAVQDMPTHPTRPTHPAQSRPAVAHSSYVLPLEFGMGWHTGLLRARTPNEDNLLAIQGNCSHDGQIVPFGLFVVADGMGGHAFGQEASRVATNAIMQTVLQNIMECDTRVEDACIELLVRGIEQANEAICLTSEARGREMGTTVTAALVIGHRAYLVNVGDSRTYLHRDELGLVQITRDHSLVARLVAVGVITPEEVYTHPQRNKVYRCVGNKDGVEVDWFTVELRAGDSLLLCSDGLWEMVRDPMMERILISSADMHQASERLVQAALHGGGVDNISVVTVRVG